MSGKDPASTADGKHNEYLQRAYALDSVDAARELYNEWATEYDENLIQSNYASPQAAVDVLESHWPATGWWPISETGTWTVLDAGCGTGLVGVCLKHFKHSLGKNVQLVLDGVDLTPGMLDVAKGKDLYRTLEIADLNESLKYDDYTYDVVFCVGTLTKGHVGPEFLAEFVRVTKLGGVIIATVHDEIWESHGYKAEVERLKQYGVVHVVNATPFGIIKGKHDGGRMVILRCK